MSTKSIVVGVEAVTPEKTQAPKFAVERLAENCRQLFGVSSCTFAGATHGLASMYTVDEMKEHIKKWSGKEVK